MDVEYFSFHLYAADPQLETDSYNGSVIIISLKKNNIQPHNYYAIFI